MKKLTLFVAAMIVVSLGYAQKIHSKDVPEVVKSGLQKQYPNAGKTEWEKEDGNYEASFKVGELEYSIVVNNAGNILETETEIDSDALPANVKAYLSKEYAGQKIKEASKITDAGGNVMYEAEIEGKDLLFDSNGNLIKEIVKKDD